MKCFRYSSLAEAESVEIEYATGEIPLKNFRQYILEHRMRHILFGKIQLAPDIRPFDSERRVVETHTTFGRFAVWIVALVGKNGIIFKNKEPMRKTARNQILLLVLACECYGETPVARSNSL
jgi:hypothetical protein